MSTPVTINGKPMGRIRAGWLLFKETWRFMMLDKELLWIPVLSLIANIFFFGALVAAMMFIALGSATEIPEDSPIWLGLLFVVYVVGAFILAFSQAAIAHIVYIRAQGGNATLSEGLRRAASHALSLFVWSLITSTVGIILHMLSERSRLFGRIVTVVLGAAWNVLTYFVVPAMVIGNQSAFAAIPQSGRVFKDSWGETAVSNVSASFIFIMLFIVLTLSGIGLVILALAYEIVWLAIILLAIYFAAFIFLMLVSSIFGGILKTLLYIYATEKTVPASFNRELIESMLVRKGAAVPSAAPMSSVV